MTSASIVAVKTCSKCGVEKSFDDFHKHSMSPDGLQYACKQCRHLDRVAKWETNPKQQITRVRNGNVETFVRGKNHGESKTPLY